MISQNATTMWETWTYSDKDFSHNHHMFGSVAEFIFHDLAGI